MQAVQTETHSAAAHNAHNTPFTKLPPELLLETASYAEDAALMVMLLRATCARFAAILSSPVDASRTTPQMREQLRTAYSALLRERALLALCKQEKKCQLKPGEKICSACVTPHDSQLFYPFQRKQDPMERKCKGREGVLHVCEHVALTYDELAERRWRVWCGQWHGAKDPESSESAGDEDYALEKDDEYEESDDGDFEDDTDSEDDEYYEYNEDSDDDDDDESEPEDEEDDSEEDHLDEAEYIQRFQSENRFLEYFPGLTSVFSAALWDGEALVSLGPGDGGKDIVARYEHVLATYFSSDPIVQERIEDGLNSLKEGVGMCSHLRISTLKSFTYSSEIWNRPFPCPSPDCHTTYHISQRQSPYETEAQDILFTVLRTVQSNPPHPTSASWIAQQHEPDRLSAPYLHNCPPHCCAERRLLTAPETNLLANQPFSPADMWLQASTYTWGMDEFCCGEGVVWPCCEMETPKCGYGTSSATAVQLQSMPGFKTNSPPYYVMGTGRCDAVEGDACFGGEPAEREWIEGRAGGLHRPEENLAEAGVLLIDDEDSVNL